MLLWLRGSLSEVQRSRAAGLSLLGRWRIAGACRVCTRTHASQHTPAALRTSSQRQQPHLLQWGLCSVLCCASCASCAARAQSLRLLGLLEGLPAALLAVLWALARAELAAAPVA